MKKSESAQSTVGMHDPSFRFHKHNILLTLFLMGLSMLFVAISAAYIYSRVQNHLPAIQLPWLFFINTLTLLASSWTLVQAERAYEEDDTQRYRQLLSATSVLSLLFLGLQFMAWVQLFQQNFFIDSNLTASYVYALSFLHFIHVVGGIPFLVYFVVQAYRKLQEPVSVLVYFSDPDKRRSLFLLTKYWHWLDILWLVLVAFLGVNMLI